MNELDMGKPRHINKWVPLLAVILASAVLVFCVNQCQVRLDNFEERLEEVLRREKNTLNQMKILEANNRQVQMELKSLHHGLAELKVNTVDTMGWKFSIIEHLINLAQLTLHGNGDGQIVEALLLSARRYANDSELTQLVRALDRDIAKLRATNASNATMVVQRLANIREQIDNLTILPGDFSSNPVIGLGEVLEKSENKPWSRFYVAALEGLKKLVVIKRGEDIPVSLQIQEEGVRLHIHMKLLQLELAAMQKNEEFFRETVAQLIATIKKYFALNIAVTNEILAQLRELETTVSFDSSWQLNATAVVASFEHSALTKNP